MFVSDIQLADVSDFFGCVNEALKIADSQLAI